jgi:hypothetical protein
LTASKRGYSTAAYEEHGDFSSAIVTGEGQDTGNLIFKLTPGAVLRGMVTADGGDPVEGAQVMLFEKPADHKPGAKIVQMDTSITDDTGAYEFDNLGNGEYLLAVKADPWYALHQSGAQRSTMNPALDAAYPITYFESTTDEASASPIVLIGGSRVEADVSLHAVPALRLGVEAPGMQNGAGGSGGSIIYQPRLRQTVFGADVSSGSAGLVVESGTGQAAFTGVAPGQYELTEGDPPRVVELDANTSQQVEPGAGIPAFPVSGTLQTETGASFTGDAVVTLEPVDNGQGLKPMASEFNHGAFSLAAVPAGRWKVEVEQSGLPLPAISVAVSGRANTRNLITVQDRAVTAVVRVSSGGMRVEGFARRGAKGVAGAMVLLVPRDPVAFPDLVRRDQSDSDGSFAIRDAAPGEYTVVAIEDGWDLDWTRPEVIGRYLPGGLAVTVTDTRDRNGDKVIRLAGPVPVQKR